MLTPKREAVLTTVRESGATHASPLRLHGASFRAGLWLYEHDMLHMVSGGFYPAPPFGTVSRELEDGSDLVRLTIPETKKIKALRGIEYTGYPRYYAVWHPVRGWATKPSWSCTELVGGPTIKEALAAAAAQTEARDGTEQRPRNQ